MPSPRRGQTSSSKHGMAADDSTAEIATKVAELAALMAEPSRNETDESQDATRTLPDRVLLTVEEAAERLNIGRTKTYALVKSGEIESVLIGRLRRVPADTVTEYAHRLLNQHRAA